MDIKEIEKRAYEILEKMTLEDRIGQLVQYGRLKEKEKEMVKKGQIGSFLNVYGAEKINELQDTIMKSNCKVPLLIGDDVIHGYRTIFPIPLAESCSWDLKLMEDTSAASAREASTEGINVVFAPMVDITRDPRWGRTAEGAGEDPYLGSLAAKARVRGIQRNDWCDRPYVTACPKHFLGYGAAEGGRDYGEADISERAIMETYLPPFKAALSEGAGTLMCSFNDLNGIPSTGNRHLMHDILRKKLKFDGVLISDWESIKELIFHGLAEDKKEAALKAINADVDIDMHSGSYEENLLQLVKCGKVKKSQIDSAVIRILKLKLKLGLFEKHYIDPSLSKNVIRCSEHIKLAKDAARKSVVLLKNEGGILPLNKDIDSIAVIGPLSDDRADLLGCWAVKGNSDNVDTVLDAVKRKVKKDCNIIFSKGSGILEPIECGVKDAVSAAKKSKVVLMVLGESADMSGENHNRAHLGIPEPQEKLLYEVLKVNKKVVLVLMNGRPLTLTWEDENVPAIVEAWHLGDESGNAVSDIIFGDYNPSGKLTMSFPRSVGQIPIYYNHKSIGRPSFKRYIDEQDSPLYPFGYGLSYTKFKYDNLKFSSKKMKIDESITVKADITNTGDFDGEEIAEFYIRDITASVTRPVRELKGFKKIYLKSKETKTVEFKITKEQLSFLDENYKPIIEPGVFKLWISPCSTGGLEGNFEVY